MNMKVSHIIESNIIQFPGPKTTKSDRVKDVVRRMDDVIKDQKDAERYAKQLLKQIDQQSEGRKSKFKSPTILAPYDKDIHPFEALEYELEDSLSGISAGREKTDAEKRFIIDFARQHISDIVRILNDDLDLYERTAQEMQNQFKNISVQYVLSPYRRRIHALKKRLKFFESFKEKYV